MAEGDGLENRWVERPRGFESLLLRSGSLVFQGLEALLESIHPARQENTPNHNQREAAGDSEKDNLIARHGSTSFICMAE